MIPTDQFRSILKRLLDKSKKGQVKWRKASDEEDAYVVTMGESYLYLRFTYDVRDRSDRYSAHLYRILQSDCPLASLAADDAGEDEEAQANFSLLQELYSDARRVVYGWDKSLDEINKLLESDQVIGDVDVPF
jgi:hypothetical protein